MKACCASVATLLFFWTSGAITSAQSPAPAVQAQAPSTSAPTLVRLDGQLKTPTGEARTGTVTIVVSLYADKDDATPLWVEPQLVTLDAAGHYSLFAGATLTDGVPEEFLSGATAGHWLGVGPQGEPEQFRMMLLTVPYALQAREADTLGGRSLTGFVLTDQLSDTVKAGLKSQLNGKGTHGMSTPGPAPLAFAANYLLKDNGSGVGIDSAVFENGGL